MRSVVPEKPKSAMLQAKNSYQKVAGGRCTEYSVPPLGLRGTKHFCIFNTFFFFKQFHSNLPVYS